MTKKLRRSNLPGRSTIYVSLHCHSTVIPTLYVKRHVLATEFVFGTLVGVDNRIKIVFVGDKFPEAAVGIESSNLWMAVLHPATLLFHPCEWQD